MTYMIRKRFYVPNDEVVRNYRDNTDKKVYNFIFKCDYEDDEEEDFYDYLVSKDEVVLDEE